MAYSFYSSRQQLVDYLLRVHSEFRKLFRNHQDLEDQIAKFDRHPYLTTDEEVDRKRLQKQKLMEKDRMEQIIRSFNERGATAT